MFHTEDLQILGASPVIFVPLVSGYSALLYMYVLPTVV